MDERLVFNILLQTISASAPPLRLFSFDKFSSSFFLHFQGRLNVLSFTKTFSMILNVQIDSIPDRTKDKFAIVWICTRRERMVIIQLNSAFDAKSDESETIWTCYQMRSRCPALHKIQSSPMHVALFCVLGFSARHHVQKSLDLTNSIRFSFQTTKFH